MVGDACNRSVTMQVRACMALLHAQVHAAETHFGATLFDVLVRRGICVLWWVLGGRACGPSWHVYVCSKKCTFSVRFFGSQFKNTSIWITNVPWSWFRVWGDYLYSMTCSVQASTICFVNMLYSRVHVYVAFMSMCWPELGRACLCCAWVCSDVCFHKCTFWDLCSWR